MGLDTPGEMFTAKERMVTPSQQREGWGCSGVLITKRLLSSAFFPRGFQTVCDASVFLSMLNLLRVPVPQGLHLHLPPCALTTPGPYTYVTSGRLLRLSSATTES